MSKVIQAKALPIIPRQVIEVPLYTHFLTAHIDPRFNNCLIWMLTDDGKDPNEKIAKEKAEILMLSLDEALDPVNAKYVGTFKDNSGAHHVFALKDSERLAFQPAAGPVTK